VRPHAQQLEILLCQRPNAAGMSKVEKDEIGSSSDEKTVARRVGETTEVEENMGEVTVADVKEAEMKEAERSEAGRREAEMSEAGRIAAGKSEAEKSEAERREAERIEAEKSEVEKSEVEKSEVEKSEVEKSEVERRESERRGAKKNEPERREAKKNESERREARRSEVERREARKSEEERREARKSEAERSELGTIVTSIAAEVGEAVVIEIGIEPRAASPIGAETEHITTGLPRNPAKVAERMADRGTAETVVDMRRRRATETGGATVTATVMVAGPTLRRRLRAASSLHGRVTARNRGAMTATGVVIEAVRRTVSSPLAAGIMPTSDVRRTTAHEAVGIAGRTSKDAVRQSTVQPKTGRMRRLRRLKARSRPQRTPWKPSVILLQPLPSQTRLRKKKA